MATLSEKAKKIGLDKDIVELKFTNFKQESEDYFYGFYCKKGGKKWK